MPYVGWESNIALAKVRGHLAIGYPRRPDGKAFQISRGGKMLIIQNWPTLLSKPVVY